MKKPQGRILAVKSGRHDSNVRPLRPERSALARLSYAPIYTSCDHPKDVAPTFHINENVELILLNLFFPSSPFYFFFLRESFT